MADRLLDRLMSGIRKTSKGKATSRQHSLQSESDDASRRLRDALRELEDHARTHLSPRVQR